MIRLCILEQWEKKWKMSFNVDKCMVLSVTRKRIPIQGKYFLHNTELKMTESAKYLGVEIDSKLSFNQHINNTCKKAYSVLGFLRRNFRNCPRKVKADLYSTYVKPILEYAVTVWAPYTRCSIDKLESVQRRAARFVMSDYYPTSSVSAMLFYLKWNKIEIQNKEMRLIMFYKILHGHVDVNLPDCVLVNTRFTRGNDLKFVQPPANIDVYKYSLFLDAIRLWNNLPSSITHADSVDNFKLYLKSFLHHL